MKSLIVAASAVAMAAVAAPAFAQGAAPQVTGYANLGYSLVDTQGAPNLSAVQGRLGARIAQYFGVEGEAGFGVGSKRLSGVDVKVKSTVAAYAVGFLPVQPNFDVFARVGYGHDTVKATLAGVSASAGEDSVNYGGGAQQSGRRNGDKGLHTQYSSMALPQPDAQNASERLLLSDFGQACA